MVIGDQSEITLKNLMLLISKPVALSMRTVPTLLLFRSFSVVVDEREGIQIRCLKKCHACLKPVHVSWLKLNVAEVGSSQYRYFVIEFSKGNGILELLNLCNSDHFL